MAGESLLTPAPAPMPKLLVTPREAAKVLSVCEKTLFTLNKRGELPAVRIGRAVRYAVADLQAFINRQKGVGNV